MSGPRDLECDFAKRTHLSHLESVVCAFQSQRKQGGSDDIRYRRRGGGPPGRQPLRNLAHRKVSCRVATRFTWNKYFDRTRNQLEHAPRMRKERPMPPWLDLNIS